MQMMRCDQPVWLGDRFIAKDTLLPVGHPDAVEPYFVPILIEDGPDTTRRKGSR